MNKIAVFLADGFEEIEALSVIDILRRAGINTLSIGLKETLVRGSHGIYVKVDMEFSNFNENEFSGIVFPGGLPGALNLAKDKKLLEIVKEFNAQNKLLAAICAAPMVFGEAGILKQNFTCYPGFESNIKPCGAKYTNEQNVVKSDNTITSRGPATAMEFALFLVKEISGEEIYKKLKNELLFQ